MKQAEPNVAVLDQGRDKTRRSELVEKVLGSDALGLLKSTSLESLSQQEALCRINPKVRGVFIKAALSGQRVSARAYCDLRGRDRQNPLLEAAMKATEEEILDFTAMMNDPDHEAAKEIWSRAEINSLQWG